jgi:hypothetical protein
VITTSHSRLMAQYNEWMNSRLYALCATLPDTELRRDRGAFFKSIYASLMRGETNFESYEKNKVERLGADAARPHRATYRKLTRD